MWSQLKGRFDYPGQRKELHRRCVESFHACFPARLKLGDEFQLDHWDRSKVEEEEAAGGQRHTIYQGPAGIGKTTIVERNVGKRCDDFDVIIVLPVNLFMRVGTNTDNHAIWREICRWIERNPGDGYVSPDAIGYALNRKRVMVVVEDLHLAEATPPYETAAERVFNDIRAYFQGHFRFERVTFVGTTREASDDLRSLEPAVTVVRVTHFNRQEAAGLFRGLCLKNGLAPTIIEENGNGGVEVFQGRELRTPLFIVLCAWLACRRPEDLRRILRLSLPQVFDRYFHELYQRSGRDHSDYRQFISSYQALVLSLWPRWHLGCRLDVVEREIERLKCNFDVSFCEKNGFLSPSGAEIQLPHHAMADYLAAAYMVESGYFKRLAQGGSRVYVDGVAPFLADLLHFERHSLIVRLADTDLPSLSAVLAEIARSGRAWQAPLQELIASFVRWASEQSGRPVPFATWRRLGESLARFHSDWDIDFCEELGRRGPCRQSILALLGIHTEGARRLLGEWLTDTPAGTEAFKQAATDPQVRDYVLGILDAVGIGTPRGRAALALGMQCPDPLNRQVLQWLASELANLTVDQNRFLIRCLHESSGSENGVCQALNELCDGQHGMVLRKACAAYVHEAGERAIVFSGAYPVETHGRPIEIAHPFLVGRQPITLSGRFRNEETAIQAVHRELNERGCDVMTLIEARVVAARYSDAESSLGKAFRGVVFHDVDDGVYAVYRDRHRLKLFTPDPEDKRKTGKLVRTIRVAFHPVYRVAEEPTQSG
jgi:hypothetical protein